MFELLFDTELSCVIFDYAKIHFAETADTFGYWMKINGIA